MKEHFLNSKSKKVLIAICNILTIKDKKLHKTAKSKIIIVLSGFSYRELKSAYNQTHFGIRRNEIMSNLKKYPNDIGGKMNLKRINELMQ